jgi:hypothetical protein
MEVAKNKKVSQLMTTIKVGLSSPLAWIWRTIRVQKLLKIYITWIWRKPFLSSNNRFHPHSPYPIPLPAPPCFLFTPSFTYTSIIYNLSF